MLPPRLAAVPLRWPRLLPCLVIALALALPALRIRPAQGRPPEAGPVPELLAPAEGEVVVESALRLAFAPITGMTRHTLLLSEEPFDTRGMTSLPAPGALRLVPLKSVVVGADDLDLTVATETRFYWAVACGDPATSAVRVSPVRSFTLVPRFRVASPPSPLIRAEIRGRITPASGGGTFTPPSRRIRLAAGFDFDTRQGEPPLTAGRQSLSAARAGARRAYIVQFDHTLSDDDRSRLAAAGAVPLSYLPDDALLVRMEAGSQGGLSSMPGVVWVGDDHPAYRVSRRVAPLGSAAVRLVALIFPDGSLPGVSADLTRMGAVIVTTSDNGINKLVHFILPASRALDVAALDDVEWVEPWVPAEVDNDNAQWVVQTNVNGNRRLWTLGVDGTGQIVHTSDSGITTGHDQFRDPSHSITGFGDYPTHRKIIAYYRGSNSPAIAFGDESGASYHGTHTAGSLCGNDAGNGTSPRDGMALGARLFFQDCSGPSLGNGIDHFPDLNDLFIAPYLGNSAGAARISSNSWGANAGGAYDVSCLQVDQFAWAHKDFLICFSNGNAGTTNSVGSPAAAKDIISVGGTQNGTLANNIYASTSRGPTDDGRRKPTVCSPAQSVYSADGATVSGYKALSGTSMASPTTAGEATLIRQYLTDGWYPTGTKVPANGFSPSAALLKALVVNSADNGVTGFTAPDNNIGYGRVMADNVCYFAGDVKKLIAIDNTPGLAQGDYIEYQIQVVSSTVPLEATLVWTDYPPDPAAAAQLVNDLNLTVSNGATTYKGNVYSGGVSATGGSYDNLNVEEAVLAASPAPGIWTVRIDAPAVPYGPQPFGLAVTGDIDNGAGTLFLDRAEYGATSTLQVRVIDTNASLPLVVHVTSPTEPAGESVSLAGGNGVFSGSLPLAPWLPGVMAARSRLTPLAFDVADDTLRVSNGDPLTATYSDASPAAVLTAHASVALEAPRITNVTGTSQGSAAAVASWDTDVNATSSVSYGLTPALELGTVTDPVAARHHEVLLPGLGPMQTCYFDVASTGLNGNATADDNGGAHYRVTVNRPSDVLLVIGDATFDRLQAYQDALAAAGWSYDTWTGVLADSAALGDTLSGLRSYRAVLWQVGFDQYPPFSDSQRATLQAYLAGGGRLAADGHDIAWAFGDATSPYYTVARFNWLRNVLHTTWQVDPATWSVMVGYTGDPISGPYTGGLTYVPFRTGGAGDEIDAVAGTGTFSYDWRDNNVPSDDVGFRWTDLVNDGSPDSALWGGTPSRLATMYFEWTAINPPFGTPNAARTDILDRTIIWLIGRDRPDVALTYPAGGETVTGDTLSIAWTETAHGGASISRRRVEYSLDSGASWNLIADGAGPSPRLWPLAPVPNCAHLRVRVTATDSGHPSLTGAGLSSADVKLARPAGDAAGPLVSPGSLAATPDPMVKGSAALLSATVTDDSRGGSLIAAAEWSRGAAAAPAGTGFPMTGSFTSPTVVVQAAIPTRPIPAGTQHFWVRGRDAAGNWGPASPVAIIVNPGVYAIAKPLGVPPMHLLPGDTLAVALRVANTGAGGDSLRWRVSDLGPGPGIAVVGAPLGSTFFAAPGETLSVPNVRIGAAHGAALGASTTLRLVAWPAGDSTARDTCTVAAVVAAPVPDALCPADTSVAPGTVTPLTFRVRNNGNLPDTLRWTLADLGPGPYVYLTGGTHSGAVYLDPAGTSTLTLSSITVTALLAAGSEQARLRLAVHADRRPSVIDSCFTVITVSGQSGVPDGAGGAPVFSAGPSRPNPFRTSAWILYSLEREDRCAVRVFSLDGRLVRTLLDERKAPGRYQAEWDGRTDAGTSVPSGIYFYRVTTSSGRAAGGRMILVR